jgi:hypothetical protein
MTSRLAQPQARRTRKRAVEAPWPEDGARRDEQRRLVRCVEELRTELVGEQPATCHGTSLHLPRD